MPKSKNHRSGGRSRDKAREARARATQAAQARAQAAKLTPDAYAKRRVLGWALVGLAMLVFVQHFISHVASAPVISPGWDDLLIGYPMAVLLAIGGASLLSRA